MFKAYGPQHWWPGDTRFEVMVGAILVQSAAWSNVEKAIANLKSADALSPRAIRQLPQEELAQLVYPAGYYNAKALKLKALAEYLGGRFDDDLDAMAREGLESLRGELIAVHGIGQETADDMLLYALGKPAFVVDSYTRRVLARLGLASEKAAYAMYQGVFTRSLPADPKLFSEYHALIVVHGAQTCRKSPLCRPCCLLEVCPTGKRSVSQVSTIGR